MSVFFLTEPINLLTLCIFRNLICKKEINSNFSAKKNNRNYFRFLKFYFRYHCPLKNTQIDKRWFLFLDFTSKCTTGFTIFYLPFYQLKSRRCTHLLPYPKLTTQKILFFPLLYLVPILLNLMQFPNS